jgi:hypothetical protein
MPCRRGLCCKDRELQGQRAARTERAARKESSNDWERQEWRAVRMERVARTERGKDRERERRGWKEAMTGESSKVREWQEQRAARTEKGEDRERREWGVAMTERAARMESC